MYSKCWFKLYFKKNSDAFYRWNALPIYRKKSTDFQSIYQKHNYLNTDSNKMAPVQNINIIQTFSKYNLHRVKA